MNLVIGVGISGVCPSGYVNNFAECIQCSGSCSRCANNSTSTCVGCSVGSYQTTSNGCSSCPTGCYTCTSAKSCQSCNTGYIIPTSSTTTPSVCQKCTWPCLTCSGQLDRCTSCLSSYERVGWACITSYRITVTARLDTNFSTFFNSSQYPAYIQAQADLAGLSVRNISISSLASGSVISTGGASVDESDTDQVNNAYNGLTNGLNSAANIAGIPIISAEVSSTGALPSSGGVNVTLILAICIPIAVICIFLITQ